MCISNLVLDFGPNDMLAIIFSEVINELRNHELLQVSLQQIYSRVKTKT